MVEFFINLAKSECFTLQRGVSQNYHIVEFQAKKTQLYVNQNGSDEFPVIIIQEGVYFSISRKMNNVRCILFNIKKNMDLKISLKTPLQIADMPLSRMKNTNKKNPPKRSAVTCIRISYRDEYLSFLAIKTQMKGTQRNIVENLQSQ